MDSCLVEETVIEVLAIVLGRAFETGNVVNRKNTPQWDSLKHIELMFALEERFGIQFSEDELACLDDVEKIAEAIGSRNAT